jgi:hypothetical protein
VSLESERTKRKRLQSPRGKCYNKEKKSKKANHCPRQIMKVIRMIQPKRRIDDVNKCDSCGSRFRSDKKQFRSLDFSRFLCEECKEGVDEKLVGLGIDTKGYWKGFTLCVQTVPEVVKVFRPRGRKGKRERTAANRVSK